MRLIRFPENRGYGAALRAGFDASRFELVAFTDADCQFDLTDLADMLPLIEKYEIVSGFRIGRQDSWLRCFYSWGYNTLVRGLLGSPLRDVDCALKLFRRDALLKILPSSANFFANSEMFTEARLLGLSINEVGVVHRPRAAGSSSVSISEIPRTLSALMPFWWRRLQFGGENPPEATSPSVLALSVLMLVAGFLLFRGLAYPLIEPDEGRYAEIAREMWVSGEWIIPQFHHEPYLDKPPLFYWLCAGSYALVGPSDWAARLVPAAAAWLTVLVTYLFGCQLLGRTAALLGSSALILSCGFVCCGRFLILDSLLALFVTTSLFAAYVAQQRQRFRWGFWLFSAACCGLGVLTKGPVALVLLVPPLVADNWLNRQSAALSVRRWSAFAGVVAVVTLPWYLAASYRMPGFVRFFFWDHNVARFLSGANHPEPCWFYIPTLFLSCMPWGLLLIPMAKSLASSSPRDRHGRSREVGFLVLSSLWCLMFFTASRSKLPTYILPGIPAIMLLVGYYLRQHCSPFASSVFQKVKAHSVFRRGLLYLAAFGIISAGCLHLCELDGRVETLVQVSLWAALLLGTVTLQHRCGPRTIYAAFCLAACAATTKLSHDVFPAWAEQRSVLDLAHRSAEELQRGTCELPVACIAGTWGSVPFYLNRDDVAVFRDSPLTNLQRFIIQHESALPIVDDDIDLKELSRSLHAGTEIRELSHTPRGMVLTIRGPAPRIHVTGPTAAKIEPPSPAFYR